MKFIKGDRVVCINDMGGELNLNKEGTIMRKLDSGYMVMFDGEYSTHGMLPMELEFIEQVTQPLFGKL